MLNHKIKLLLVLSGSFLFFSCTKKTNDKLDQLEKFEIFDPSSQAMVNFIHAYTPLTLNGASTTTTGFRLFMDGEKLNGSLGTSGSTNSLVYGGTFPASITYAFLPAGQRNFKYTMNRVSGGAFVPIAGDEIFNATVNLERNKKYSVFIADPYPAPNVHTVQDNFQEPSRNKYGIRFINLCGDVNSKFDVVSARFGSVLFSNVGYKEMKDYIYLDVTATDTLYLRNAGTTTVVSQVNTFVPGSQKVYTFYARGKTGVTGRLPNLTFYSNR